MANDRWEEETGSLAMEWVKHGVNIDDFMTPFQGDFQGEHYHSEIPLEKSLPNAKITTQFDEFISKNMVDRVKSGAIKIMGRVGQVAPPHVVSPITVEPLKPRMCIDMRYLNNWMKKTPFSLDSLTDIPRIASRGSFMTKLDDKSGYDHVLVTEASTNFFGFQWKGWYFVCRCIPFGWTNSAFVYQSLNLQPVSFLRKLGVPVLLYIDDRWVEKWRGKWMGPLSPYSEGFLRSLIAIHMTTQLLVRLGFYLGLEKSVLTPTTCLVFLGMLTDTSQLTFSIPDTKKLKCARLREQILGEQAVSVNTMQSFIGRCISFILAVPAAKLYTVEANLAVGRAIKEGRQVYIDAILEQEIASWRFLDGWAGCLPWKPEFHSTIVIYTDSSDFRWGGVVKTKEGSEQVGDYWPDNFKQQSIMVKEARALTLVLASCKERLANSRVDAQVDNSAVIGAWNAQGSRTHELNEEMKLLFDLVHKRNIHLCLQYVASKENEADAPSRLLHKSDAKLATSAWDMLQNSWGGEHGHTLDLMSLDSNVMMGKNGDPLPHFTPYPTPGSAGVNMFAQIVGSGENCYVFPPQPMIPAVINFIEQEKLNCSLVVPSPIVTPVWMPHLLAKAKGVLKLGEKGSRNVLLYPSRKGYHLDKKGLPSVLLGVRLERGGPHIQTSEHKEQRVLVVGDSMVRFLSSLDWQNKHSAKLVAIGGATLKILQGVLEYQIGLLNP